MDKRKDILATALRLFAHHGYTNVGVDRIIAESGVAKMTLYKQFGTKEGLIKEVLKYRDEVFLEDLFSYVSGFRGKNEKLRAIFEWHRSWFTSQEFHGCIFIKASEEFDGKIASVNDVVLRHKQAIIDFIRSVLEEDMTQNAEMKAHLIFVCIEGLTVSANMFKTDRFVDSVWASIQPCIDS